MGKKFKDTAQERKKNKQSKREKKIKDRVEHIENIKFEVDAKLVEENDRNISFQMRRLRSYNGKGKSNKR